MAFLDPAWHFSWEVSHSVAIKWRLNVEVIWRFKIGWTFKWLPHHMCRASGRMAETGGMQASPMTSWSFLIAWQSQGNWVSYTMDWFPYSTCSKRSRQNCKTSQELAAEVHLYHFYHNLLIKIRYYGQIRFKGQSIQGQEHQVTLGAIFGASCHTLTKFFHICALPFKAFHNLFYSWIDNTQLSLHWCPYVVKYYKLYVILIWENIPFEEMCLDRISDL